VVDEQQRKRQGGGEVLAGRYKQRRCVTQAKSHSGKRDAGLGLGTPSASMVSHACFLASLAVDCEGAGAGAPASRRFSSLVAAYLWAKTSK
jgi:hypothetical protein